MVIRVPYTATNEEHRFVITLEDEDGAELPIGEAPPGVDTPDGKIRRIDPLDVLHRPEPEHPEHSVILGEIRDKDIAGVKRNLVDNSEWATVRSIQLELLCTEEGE